MTETTTTASPFVVALSLAIRDRHAQGAFGVILSGFEDVPLMPLLNELGGPGRVFVSVVGSPDAQEFRIEAEQAGWSTDQFGVDATHANAVRNDAPAEALKLVVVWREESRLHSLRKRGYEVVGPRELIREVCTLGAARAPNQPQRELWRALGLPTLSVYPSPESVLDYYARIYADEAAEADTPRRLLPQLGFLADPQLLGGRYTTADAITRRLVANATMVERILRADEEDRQKASQSVRSANPADRPALEQSYGLFLRLARNDLDVLGELSYDSAERLLVGSKPKPTTPERPEPTPEDPDDPTPPGPKRREFSTLAAAAIRLAAAGEADLLTTLVKRAEEHLRKDENPSGRLEVADVGVQFTADERALAIGRKSLGEGFFGGSLRSLDHPTDVLLKELGRHIDQFKPFDDVRTRTLQDLLNRARLLLPSFEGAALLEDYVARRSKLVPSVDLLVTSPLACMVAKDDVRTAATEAIQAYQRLLSHLEDSFAHLRKKSVGGTTLLYNEILSLDLIRIQGEDELVVLLSPLTPLVLWKYVELANLVLDSGRELLESDQDLLADEIADLPEPLLAVHAPGDTEHDSVELAYAERLGSMPLYRPVTLEASDLSERSLRIAGAKLLALYPPARENLRVALLDPSSTRNVSRAIKTLIQKHELGRSTITIWRTKQQHEIDAATDTVLDELSAEGLVTVEEFSIGSPTSVSTLVAKKPVHLLGLSGAKRKNVELIESEGTRLHPLSLPHRLHADPLLGTVTLRPRSVQPTEDAPPHPFGFYHNLISQLSGNPYSEFSLGGSQRTTLSDFAPAFPHAQLLVVTADLPDSMSEEKLLRLTQGIDLAGDAVFTHHRERIVRGMDALLRRLNYQPTSGGLQKLLDRIREVGGEGIFAAVSEKSVNGFSPTALQGQLGLAVALNWYSENTAGECHMLLSLDSFLARRWLQRREQGERNDLIGFRQLDDGSVAIDLVEVKSYESTTDEDVTESHAGKQLRSVAKTLYEMLNRQGDILIDRRRELLRLQVFREGLLAKPAALDTTWVGTLNDVLDGTREATLSLSLIELAFEENVPLDDRVFPAEGDVQHPVDAFPVRRLRLGEPDIQRLMEGVLEWTGNSSDVSIEAQPEGAGEPAPAPVSEGQEQGAGVQAESADTTTATQTQVEDSGGETLAPGVTGHEFGFDLASHEYAEVEQTAQAIYRVLQDIGIGLAAPVDPAQADVGPSIVRYKLRLKVGERVTSLQSRARDLMRELATDKEPIIDNLPNTNYVYIDLPRPQPQAALFRPYVESLPVQNGETGLRCPFGVTPDGNVEWFDLTALPHMLVAGSTGSGKTMFLYSLIVGLARLYGPQDVQLLLIDPKETDFVFFSRLKHLRTPEVITDSRQALDALKQLLTEDLEARTARLKETFSRDIKSHNARHPDNPIAPVVVVIDEFADLADVMDRTEREDFDLSMRRLAQRARNVGIHLVLATQRPTADIVNGTLKTNLPCRVSFRLASQVDSRTILDRGGAEHLLGKGDMLVSWNGSLQRLQGFFLPEDDIIALLDLNRG
jgi:hypothetical protein